MIRFGEVTASDCIYIAKHMRERDAQEISAVMPDVNPVDLGMHVFRLWQMRGVGGFVAHADKPFALMTVTRETPCAAQVTMFATDDFAKWGKSVTRHIVKHVVPELMASGLMRVEARCWDGHEQARNWMSRIGAKEEARIEGYGANGETFIQMAWLKCA